MSVNKMSKMSGKDCYAPTGAASLASLEAAYLASSEAKDRLEAAPKRSKRSRLPPSGAGFYRTVGMRSKKDRLEAALLCWVEAAPPLCYARSRLRKEQATTSG